MNPTIRAAVAGDERVLAELNAFVHDLHVTNALDAVVRTAEAHEIAEVELTCWDFNHNAQEAFRRLGFTPRLVRFGRRLGG